MKPLTIFDLKKHPGKYETWPLETELIEEGDLTGKSIPGFVLETQYEYRDVYLLVTSWDCLFEESQTIMLLSKSLDVLGKKTIGAAYATVWFKHCAAISDNCVLFRFAGDANLNVLVTIKSGKKLVVETFDRASGAYKKI